MYDAYMNTKNADRAKYLKAYNQKNKALGKCRCGKNRVPERTRCQSCITSDKEHTQRRNKERLEMGQCRHCGKTPEPGTSKCASCKKVGRNWLLRQKATVIAAYGGKCECCGEKEPTFMTIDHINNDGAEHRKSMKTNRIHSWLIKNGFPKQGFRLLCFNCNMGRRVNGGVCPHADS